VCCSHYLSPCFEKGSVEVITCPETALMVPSSGAVSSVPPCKHVIQGVKEMGWMKTYKMEAGMPSFSPAFS
jgi:hypothetical protein